MPESNAKSARRISRRTVLRGAGVTMALPWLNRFPLLPIRTAPAAFPKRFAVLFMGNGINEDHWSAEGSGADMELSKTLEPLEPLKHEDQRDRRPVQQARHRPGHSPGADRQPALGRAHSEGRHHPGGHQLDQMIANRLGQDTPQPSIVLACEQPMTGYHETNFSMAYSSHISWQTPDSPVPVEVYPSLAFDNLFDNRGSRATSAFSTA